MRMVQGRARGPALVFEHQHVPEAAVALKIQDAVSVGPEHFFNLAFGKVLEAEPMLRTLDDDLMGPDAVHPVVDAATLPLETAFDMQYRKLAGNDTHPPARLVRQGLLGAERCDLRRGLRLVPPAERTFSRCHVVRGFFETVLFGF